MFVSSRVIQAIIPAGDGLFSEDLLKEVIFITNSSFLPLKVLNAMFGIGIAEIIVATKTVALGASQSLCFQLKL